MSVLFIVDVLIFTSFCVTGRGGVIDGKWDFIRNSRVSMPGPVAVLSGISSSPKELWKTGTKSGHWTTPAE